MAVTEVVQPGPAAAPRAIEVLRGGGMVTLPTDVGYLVLADAFDTAATQALRADEDRLVMLVRGPRQVIGVAEVIPEEAERLMAAFWPGPLAVTCAAAHGVGLDLGGAPGTVTVRMPAGDLLHELLSAVGPLACGTPTQTAEAAGEARGARVVLAVDAGRCGVRRVTVVDVTAGGARLVEHGAVGADEVQAAVAGHVGWGGTPPT